MLHYLQTAACGVCILLAGSAFAQQVGEEAPDFRVPKSENARSDKDTISLFERYSHRILVLYYWSSLDSASLDFFSTLDELAEKYGPRGVTILGLCRQNKKVIDKVEKERKPKFDLVQLNPMVGTFRDYMRTWRFPAPGITYIIDTHRRVAYARFDATDPRENLEEKIQAVLAKTPTLAATEELLQKNIQKVSEFIEKGEIGRAYTLATTLKAFFRDREDIDLEEQAEELLRQISLGAQKQLESAQQDFKEEKYEDAAAKLAELSVRLTGLGDDTDKRGRRRSSRSSRQRARRPRGGQAVEPGKDFREIKENVEREIGRMQSDNYTKAIILKALDNARGQVRNDSAAECMEFGQYSIARQLYNSVVEEFADTEAAEVAQEALDHIENDPQIQEAIAKSEASEQAERWYELGDRFARAEMFDKSREYFEKVIKGYPDSAAAQNARDRLARMEDDVKAAGEGRRRREKLAPPKDDTKIIEQARAIVQKLIDGDYRGFVEAGDDQLRASLNEQKARQLWADLQTKLGKFKSLDQGKLTPVLGLQAVTFVAEFERGTRGLRIVFSTQGKMAEFNQVEVKP